MAHWYSEPTRSYSKILTKVAILKIMSLEVKISGPNLWIHIVKYYPQTKSNCSKLIKFLHESRSNKGKFIRLLAKFIHNLNLLYCSVFAKFAISWKYLVLEFFDEPLSWFFRFFVWKFVNNLGLFYLINAALGSISGEVFSKASAIDQNLRFAILFQSKSCQLYNEATQEPHFIDLSSLRDGSKLWQFGQIKGPNHSKKFTKPSFLVLWKITKQN